MLLGACCPPNSIYDSQLVQPKQQAMAHWVYTWACLEEGGGVLGRAKGGTAVLPLAALLPCSRPRPDFRTAGAQCSVLPSHCSLTLFGSGVAAPVRYVKWGL